MPAVLASAPGDACCATGFIHGGTPKGVTITLGGLQTYVSRPTGDTDKIILFFPDVHGPFHINNQLLMDYFASIGYLIISPDYFEGDPIFVARERADWNRAHWVKFNLERGKVTVPKWVDAVATEFGNETTKYGTVGYCFGAPFVLDICATDRVKAGAIAHPAFLDEDHFRKLKQPIFLSCSEVDHTFSTESRHTSEAILAEIKAKYQYQLFSGVVHGFALRGNMDVENERWAKEESAKGIVGWWNRFVN
ncbi:alpha/beta-hydrolase [Ramaria rubella]|nr:alpha/beta-hydrolase [Ramaria rubella]